MFEVLRGGGEGEGEEGRGEGREDWDGCEEGITCFYGFDDSFYLPPVSK